MGDLIYVDRELKKFWIQPEDVDLQDAVKNLKKSITILVSDIRNKIGGNELSLELCKNVAYYLKHMCLTESTESDNLKKEKTIEVCKLDEATYKKLDIIKKLVQDYSQIWDLVFEIHKGYLGYIADKGMQVKFFQQKQNLFIQENEYQSLVNQLRISRKPLV